MSSPGVWNPDQECDNEDNDVWFDASDKEMNEDELEYLQELALEGGGKRAGGMEDESTKRVKENYE